MNDLTNTLSVKSLYTEDWLLVYESAVHGWLQTRAIVSQDPYFNMLITAPCEVSFYDINDRADYRSKTYIQTLPYNFYPQHMQDDAENQYNGIVSRLTRHEVDERDIDVANQEAIDDVREEVELHLQSMDAETTIYDFLLEKIFNGELTDEVINNLVAEYAPLIAAMREY